MLIQHLSQWALFAMGQFRDNYSVFLSTDEQAETSVDEFDCLLTIPGQVDSSVQRLKTTTGHMVCLFDSAVQRPRLQRHTHIQSSLFFLACK